MDRKHKLFNRKNLSRIITIPLLIFILAACGGGGGDGDGGNGGNGATQNELNVEILDASISSPATVTFRLTNADGNPIGLKDVGMNFILARIEPGQDEYIDYITRINDSAINPGETAIQADSESEEDGTLEDLGDGMFKYTFITPIPDDFNENATHTVGIYATKDIGSQRYVSNDTFDFIPAGGDVDTVRDIVRTEACNTCHDPLEAHGGSRRDVKLCILCHTSKIADPDTGEIIDHIDPGSGNNLGFKIMIHKIHRGKDLPSVNGNLVPAPTPYIFEGFRGNIDNFSTVGFPQDIRNCTKCHTDAAEQSDNYRENLSRAACGSCHDNVDFLKDDSDPTFQKNHPFVVSDDNNCSGCHLPSGAEFTNSVPGAHTVQLKSQSLPGLHFEIVSVKSLENPSSDIVAPGEHPVVTFNIRNDNGDIIDPSNLNSLSLVLSGSTTDYSIQDYNGDGDTTGTPNGEEYFARERDALTDSVPAGSGNFAYTFDTAIPDNAFGTYAIGIEGRREVTVGGGGPDIVVGATEVEEAGMNQVFYFPVTDTSPVERRQVVSNTKCGSCHGTFSKDFSVHGNLRNNVQYCVLCHNHSADDLSQRPASDSPTETIDFKVMIHKIHTGENLSDSSKPYIIYGFGGNPVDLGEVLYPGNRSDCEVCHLPDTHLLLNTDNNGLKPGVKRATERAFTQSGEDAPKIVTDIFTTTPVVAVCTSCHDYLIVNDSGDGITAGSTVDDPDRSHPFSASESECVDCHIAGMPLGVDNPRIHIPLLPPDERIERPQPE